MRLKNNATIMNVSLVAPLDFSLRLAFPFYNFTLLDSQGIFRTHLWLDLMMSGLGGWPGWVHFIKGVASLNRDSEA